MDQNFIKAYPILLGNERGYTNNIVDAGGETIDGISRRYHPECTGIWEFIDKVKEDRKLKGLGDIPEGTRFPEIADLVMSFYYLNYWTANYCHKMPYNIALDVLDIAVNMGSSVAGSFLQKALNVSNLKGKKWSNLVIDGNIGKNTIEAVECAKLAGKAEMISLWINCLRGAYYINIMSKDESQEVFAQSWANRVEIRRVN